MKSTALLTLPLAASAAVINTRQLGFGAPLPMVGTEKLQPKIRPDAERTLTRWGPLNMLPGSAQKPFGSFSMDPKGQTFMSVLKDGFCKDCSVLVGQLGLALENGTKATMADGIYTHHALTFVNKKQENWIATCDTAEANAAAPTSSSGLGSLAGAGFVMVGEDNGDAPVYYASKTNQFEAGYYIPPNGQISVQSDLVNYKDTPSNIYITLDIEYLKGKVGADSKTKLMSVTGCGGRAIAMDPAKESKTTSQKFTIYEDGYIINGKGHLHDGGVAMLLNINDKEVCTSAASYGGAGGTLKVDGKTWETINGMSECKDPIPVKKGDYVTMTAIYDLPKHPLRETAGAAAGVMGMWDLTFAAVPGASAEALAKAPKSAAPAAVATAPKASNSSVTGMNGQSGMTGMTGTGMSSGGHSHGGAPSAPVVAPKAAAPADEVDDACDAEDVAAGPSKPISSPVAAAPADDSEEACDAEDAEAAPTSAPKTSSAAAPKTSSAAVPNTSSTLAPAAASTSSMAGMSGGHSHGPAPPVAAAAAGSPAMVSAPSASAASAAPAAPAPAKSSPGFTFGFGGMGGMTGGSGLGMFGMAGGLLGGPRRTFRGTFPAAAA